MKRKKSKIKYLLVLIVLLAVIGCYLFFGTSLFKGKEENSKSGNKPSPKKPVETVKIVDLESKNRPYAIMINNLSVARPLQSGLQDAYIIYEMIVEGGITRYLALFQDANVDRIGPVRSARHYYVDYALENDAIYCHNGNSPQAAAAFSKYGLDRIEVEAPKTGIRDKSLNVSREHTLFTSTSLLANGIGKKRTTRNKGYLLDYSVKPVDIASKEGAIAANSISIRYSNNTTSSYQYDPEAKVYKRFVNGKEHTDYVTKNQYTFKNIITYQVKNTTLNDGENKGRQDLSNTGSGTGYYITEGYAVPITWSKDSHDTQTIYKYNDGTKIKVNDGNTFIQIQPLGESLVIE